MMSDQDGRAGNNSDPETDTVSEEARPLAPEDFYYEGPYLVFTAAYHLKRGYCCNSGCRHCPYR
jgi:Family of unknown function (DUF5522)